MDNRKISYRAVATELRKRTSKNDVQRMSTDNMAADIFTKSLLEAVFKKRAMRIQGMAQQRKKVTFDSHLLRFSLMEFPHNLYMDGQIAHSM